MGQQLASRLNNAIDGMETEETSRADIVSSMGDAAGIESGTVNQILDGDINCPPLNRLEGFADVLDVSLSSLTNAAEEDGCNYEEDRSLWRRLYDNLKSLFQEDRAISFQQIYEQAFDMTWETGWLIDVYDDAGQMYALLARDGLLFRQPLGLVDDQIVLAGDAFQVATDHPAVQTRTTIERQADGRYRWFSISATSVLNRVGEIDSQALFQSFEAHIEETGDYPIRQFYHQGDQFRTGQGDFVAWDDNALITSGLFDETELAQREIKAREKAPTYWGESIGYLPTSVPDMVEIKEGISIPVYRTGILKEISTLPENQAANLFTVTVQHKEVNRMLTGKAREAFTTLFDGDEEAAEKWLTENVDELNRSIQESGLITREKPEEDEEDAPEPVPAVVERVNQLQEQIKEVIGALETINANQADMVTRLEGLKVEERLEKLERSTVQQLEETLADMPSVPQVQRLIYQPRQGNARQKAPAGSMADVAKSMTSFY